MKWYTQKRSDVKNNRVQVNVGEINMDTVNMGSILARYFRPLIKNIDVILVYL